MNRIWRFGLVAGIALFALAIIRVLWPAGSVRPLIDPQGRIAIYHDPSLQREYVNVVKTIMGLVDGGWMGR